MRLVPERTPRDVDRLEDVEEIRMLVRVLRDMLDYTQRRIAEIEKRGGKP